MLEHSVGETTAPRLVIKKEAQSTKLSSQTRNCVLSSLAVAPAAALSLQREAAHSSPALPEGSAF